MKTLIQFLFSGLFPFIISCGVSLDGGDGDWSKYAPPLPPPIPYGSVTDIEGNSYITVGLIGQIWMAENLRTTKFSDGTSVQLISDSVKWINMSSPSYCWYNNEVDKSGSGALYNYYTVGHGKLCPTGWHVPSIEDWNYLILLFGGNELIGYNLSQKGFFPYWCGYRDGADGSFLGRGNTCIYFSSTVSNNLVLFIKYSVDSKPYEKGEGSMKDGYSVRCVKDP